MDNVRKRATLESMGWRGFFYVYFKCCKKQLWHSARWSVVATIGISLMIPFSTKTLFEMIVCLTDIGLKVAPPLLGFTLSGYALIVGFKDGNLSERIKLHVTKNGLTMYQQLYTTFVAMLGAIFLLLIESSILYIAIKAELQCKISVVIVNSIVFPVYSFSMFYALFAVKDLLSNLFSLGQVTNNYYKSEQKEKGA